MRLGRKKKTEARLVHDAVKPVSSKEMQNVLARHAEAVEGHKVALKEAMDAHAQAVTEHKQSMQEALERHEDALQAALKAQRERHEAEIPRRVAEALAETMEIEKDTTPFLSKTADHHVRALPLPPLPARVSGADC